MANESGTSDGSRGTLRAGTGAAGRLAALLAALATACAQPPAQGDAKPGGAAGPERHGQALTGSPACAGPSVHRKHVSMFRCDICHPTGATFGFDRPYTFARGTTTAGGTMAMSAGNPTTCTVACHFPNGAAPRSVAWNAAGPLACTACHDTARLPSTHPPVAPNAPRADCEACHVLTGHTDGTVQASGHAPAWSDAASPGFHAYAANQGLSACTPCHGADLSGGSSGRSCGSCHDASLPPGVTSWLRNCVMCHGGTDNQTGAPPAATWGNAGDAIRTGAHSRHVTAGPLAPAADCSVCHQRPADALATSHLDAGPAEVTFAGIAASGVSPSWTRGTATCASTYCHGGRLQGGTLTAPVWTGGPSQAACGTCHGLPPPAPHPAAVGLGSCATCHALTMTAAGTVIPPAGGGKHMDGIIEASGGAGGVHGAAWLDPSSTGFHAYSANEGLAGCQGCHGPNLDGVGGSSTVSCASCHGAGWLTSCTACHGGTNDGTGAPPRTTWGNSGDPLRTGAHARHVGGGAASLGFDCSVCHPVPTSALSPNHVGPGPATVTFGGLATTGGAVNPSWSRATGSCAATYCHGGYSGTFTYFFWDAYYDAPYAGSNATPAWTGEAPGCTSCHGAPTRNGVWHSGLHGDAVGGNDCSLCHPGVDAAGTAFTDRSRHVDGIVDVTPTWTTRCIRCH